MPKHKPLIQGYSRKSVSANIHTEVKRGHSPKQAVAIALSVAEKARERAKGRKK